MTPPSALRPLLADEARRGYAVTMSRSDDTAGLRVMPLAEALELAAYAAGRGFSPRVLPVGAS